MNIKYFMIHCKEHTEREKYINTVITKLQKPVTLIDGVYTKNVKLDKQVEFINTFDSRITFNPTNNFKFYLPGQIGCYLSHWKIIQQIKTEAPDYDYAIVFEDDVSIPSNLDSNVHRIIDSLKSKSCDFDYLHLGTQNDNHGQHIINNAYYIDKTNYSWGTHAMLYKVSNINKIFDSICNIKHEIDNHLNFSVRNGELTGLTIYPSLCGQNASFPSNIKNV